MGASSRGNQIPFPCCYSIPVHRRARAILGVLTRDVTQDLLHKKSLVAASRGQILTLHPAASLAGAAVLRQPWRRGWGAAGTPVSPRGAAGASSPPAGPLRTSSAPRQPCFVPQQARNPAAALGLSVLRGWGAVRGPPLRRREERFPGGVRGKARAAAGDPPSPAQAALISSLSLTKTIRPPKRTPYSVRSSAGQPCV